MSEHTFQKYFANISTTNQITFSRYPYSWWWPGSSTWLCETIDSPIYANLDADSSIDSLRLLS